MSSTQACRRKEPRRRTSKTSHDVDPNNTGTCTTCGKEDVVGDRQATEDTAADVQVGRPAPAFTVETEAGPISRDSLVGHPVVLYFYPRDMTPGCTTEACDFRDANAEFQRLGAQVIGISTDSLESHARFQAKHQLPFLLASDPEAQAARLFGVWKEKNLYGKRSFGIERSTFVLDADGRVAALWRRVKVPGHVEQVLEAVRALVGG
jgi:peroxiredoxin Q/BCP